MAMKRMRKKKCNKLLRIVNMIAGTVFLAGVVIWLYPKGTQWFFDRDVENFVKEFDTSVREDGANLRLEELYQFLLAENQRLYGEGQKDLKDPFAVAYPGIDLAKYGLPDQTIGYIDIPKIDECLPIYLGANDANMKRGAVHLTGTSYPIGGMDSNSVIAAHRGYYKATMFRKIDQIEVGDEVFIRNFRETLVYRVTSTLVIDPNESDRIFIQEGKDMLTLFSCHPYPTNRQRYVVYCERVIE